MVTLQVVPEKLLQQCLLGLHVRVTVMVRVRNMDSVSVIVYTTVCSIYGKLYLVHTVAATSPEHPTPYPISISHSAVNLMP